MKPPGLFGATSASSYVQAIPIYLQSDSEVVRYFRDCRDEIDQITGTNIPILLAKEMAASDTAGIVAALDRRDRSRFSGLRFGDLPCLWVEDEFNRSTIVRLPHEFHQISQLLRTLADVCRETKDAPTIGAEITRRLEEDAESRPGGDHVKKTNERRLALIFGVIFVAAILGVAIFIPSPTAFQYTVFRIILALAAGGFVSMTPGFIEAKVGNVVRGGGALAVFLIVFFYAPAALEAFK